MIDPAPAPVTVLSFATHLGESRRRQLVERLPGGSRVADSGTNELVVAAPEPALASDPAALVLAGTHSTRGERIDAAWVRARAEQPDPAWADAVPPFAALLLRGAGPDRTAVAVTDPIGLGPVVHAQGEGWAALSTSALLLGALTGGALDEDALLDLALTGTFVGSATAYHGVRKLDAGQTAELRAGRCTIRHYDSGGGRGRAEICDGGPATGAAVLRHAVAAAVEGRDRVVLELSGGLDSRVLLAASSADDRRRIEAVSIGTAATPDVKVAMQVAEAAGLPHRTVDLAGLTGCDPDGLHAAALASARAHDCGGNPLAHLVLDHADHLIGSAPRLSGQNGELARGFYYGGQPPWPRANRVLIRGLERWRLTTNDAVDSAVLRPGAVEATHERLTSGLVDAFATFPPPWLRATDHLYLRLRMHRWVGAAYWSACRTRPVLAPYFDPRFVTWALEAAPTHKRGSKLTASVLRLLDPSLARLPLDNGLLPDDLAAGTLRTRARLASRSTRKLAAKVAQRRRAGTRPPVATSDLASSVREHWRRDSATLDRVAELPFLEGTTVASIASGTRPADAATVGFLLALEALLSDHL